MAAEGNGDLQTLICVLVARPRRCPTLSNPVPWQNWMAAYLGYTLRMKTLFHGWPVMVHDMHTRRRRFSWYNHNVKTPYSTLYSSELYRVNKTWSRCTTDIETLSLGNILQLCRVRSFYIGTCSDWRKIKLSECAIVKYKEVPTNTSTNKVNNYISQLNLTAWLCSLASPAWSQEVVQQHRMQCGADSHPSHHHHDSTAPHHHSIFSQSCSNATVLWRLLVRRKFFFSKHKTFTVNTINTDVTLDITVLHKYFRIWFHL